MIVKVLIGASKKKLAISKIAITMHSIIMVMLRLDIVHNYFYVRIIIIII